MVRTGRMLVVAIALVVADLAVADLAPAQANVYRLAITALAASSTFASPYTFSCAMPLPTTLPGGACASTFACADDVGDELSETDEPASVEDCRVDIP